MKRIVGLILCCLSLSSLSSAKSSKNSAIFIGHNVTPTTDTLAAGEWTVGTYAVGVGLTDSLFIATSPWIGLSYNTANVHLKWADDFSADSRWGVFLSYFESYDSEPFLRGVTGSNFDSRPDRNNGGRPPGSGGLGGLATTTYVALSRYQWKSGSVHALYSKHWDSGDVLYFNLHYAYFWDDEFPYSIRMDPGSDDIRDQVDLTALAKIRLGASDFYWNFEAGGLGLNYIYPYLQVGSSLAYASSSWLVQVGASYTVRFSEAGQASGWRPGRYDTRQHYSETEEEYYYYRYLQTALHPEIQLQYFF
ncbi:MAG: hypothetical protein AAGB31_15710 [Bdellovibrio sp.]